MKFKIIKSKAFEAKGQKAIHYSVAFKGRVFGVNSLRFSEEPEDTLKVEGDVLTISCDVAVLKRVDSTLEGTKTYHDLVPKVTEFALADF